MSEKILSRETIAIAEYLKSRGLTFRKIGDILGVGGSSIAFHLNGHAKDPVHASFVDGMHAVIAQAMQEASRRANLEAAKVFRELADKLEADNQQPKTNGHDISSMRELDGPWDDGRS